MGCFQNNDAIYFSRRYPGLPGDLQCECDTHQISTHWLPSLLIALHGPGRWENRQTEQASRYSASPLKAGSCPSKSARGAALLNGFKSRSISGQRRSPEQQINSGAISAAIPVAILKDLPKAPADQQLEGIFQLHMGVLCYRSILLYPRNSTLILHFTDSTFSVSRGQHKNGWKHLSLTVPFSLSAASPRKPKSVSILPSQCLQSSGAHLQTWSCLYISNIWRPCFYTYSKRMYSLMSIEKTGKIVQQIDHCLACC